MLIGEYVHTLDAKKRLALPAKFRKALGKTVVVTRGLDACLFLYPLDQWGKIAEKLANLPLGQAEMRGFNRYLLAGAVELEIDALGRILVPDFLKSFAKLKERVVVTGVYTRVEIWEEETWKRYQARILESGEGLAQKLGELGAF